MKEDDNKENVMSTPTFNKTQSKSYVDNIFQKCLLME
jgi:hypothetical protein